MNVNCQRGARKAGKVTGSGQLSVQAAGLLTSPPPPAPGRRQLSPAADSCSPRSNRSRASHGDTGMQLFSDFYRASLLRTLRGAGGRGVEGLFCL